MLRFPNLMHFPDVQVTCATTNIPTPVYLVLRESVSEVLEFLEYVSNKNNYMKIRKRLFIELFWSQL